MNTPHFFFAELPPGIGFEAAGCIVVGVAVAVLALWGIRLLISEDLQQGIEWRYDVSRINELRRMDVFYRLFQPAIQLLARLNRKVFADSMSTIYRELQAAGLPRFWLPKNTWPSCN